MTRLKCFSNWFIARIKPSCWLKKDSIAQLAIILSNVFVLAEGIITVPEKGGHEQPYVISDEGLQAIRDYLDYERSNDAECYGDCSALFLAAGNTGSGGVMKPRQISRIWDEVCRIAGVSGKSPHSARHGLGKYIMEKAGNVAAVQRQLGHKNAAYSLQYARIGRDELKELLNGR